MENKNPKNKVKKTKKPMTTKKKILITLGVIFGTFVLFVIWALNTDIPENPETAKTTVTSQTTSATTQPVEKATEAETKNNQPSKNTAQTKTSPKATQKTEKSVAATKKSSTPATSKSSSSSYVGNAKSKVLHRPNCPSVKRMNDSNKVYFKSKDQAVGYKPCSNCNP